MVPNFGNVDPMFGLEVYGMPFTIEFPIPLAIGEQSKHLGVVGGLLKTILRIIFYRF